MLLNKECRLKSYLDMFYNPNFSETFSQFVTTLLLNEHMFAAFAF